MLIAPIFHYVYFCLFFNAIQLFNEIKKKICQSTAEIEFKINNFERKELFSKITESFDCTIVIVI
jgi:hypothetical protein